MTPPKSLHDSIHDSNDLPAVCARKFTEIMGRVVSVEGHWRATWALVLAVITCIGSSGYLWYATQSNASAAAVERNAIKDAGVAERQAMRDAQLRDSEATNRMLLSIQTDVREIRNRLDK